MTRDRAAAAQVFVSDLELAPLEVDDARHLGTVLRLRPGERVIAADGAGRSRECAYRGKDEMVLEPIAPVIFHERPAPLIGVGFAPLKGDRTSWTVQKLTEIGVDTLVPVLAQRSVVRIGRDGTDWEKASDRLTRIARAAAAQSRRKWLPEIMPPATLADLAKRMPVAVAHFDGEAPDLLHPFIAIGPEGGWTDEELGLTQSHVHLGPSVLRAETAALAAGVLMCALRSGITKPVNSCH